MHRLILIVVLAGAALGAQGPAFEVASVKRNVTNSTSSSTDDRPPGTYTVVNMALRRIITIAYRLHPVLDRDRIIGPDWIDTARFDIAARAPAGTPVEQNPDMLLQLLRDRFKLAARVEMREAPIYAMVPARTDGRLGPQLTPSSLDCSKKENFLSPSVGAGGVGADKPATQKPQCGIISTKDANGAVIRGGGRSLADLAKNLTGRTDRPVVDRSGLSGAYDFVLAFTPEGMTPRTDGAVGPNIDGTSLFTALQEQLGLKLEAQRGQVEFIVIDRIEQPTPD
jgi:uncharacterized protein (TIGR03435 family)